MKLYKLNFDGHINMDFPVKVSVSIDPSYFTEEDTIYAYHIADDGTVEFLGEAWSYAENGKVNRIEFMTNVFSDFFVSTQKLATDENAKVLSGLLEDNNLIFIAFGAVIVLPVVLTIFLLERKTQSA